MLAYASLLITDRPDNKHVFKYSFSFAIHMNLNAIITYCLL